MVALLGDDFYSAAGGLNSLVTAGYVVTSVSRYEPTVVTGASPKGVAFSMTVNRSTATLTYRGKALAPQAVTSATWYASTEVVSLIESAVTAAGG